MMGKSTLKIKNKEEKLDEYDEKMDELYRPFLIHSTTYVILTDQILSLMPSQRNVMLTMNEYCLNDINPVHPNNEESPTHVIIFCVRFIADDTFQPIGGLLIYKQEDQSVLLAECLKAYINDLWKLGLYVVATVSPPFETFKGIINNLVDIKNVDTFSGAITYSVSPFKEIVHIYDIQFLLIKLQNLFKEGDIKFVEGSREYLASWNDISLVLSLCPEFKIISNYLTDNKDVSRRVHIFTQQIFEQFLEMEAEGILSEVAGGSAVLLNIVRTFLQFTELDFVDLKLMQEVDCWDALTHILQTMLFQKSTKRTCTKLKPSKTYTITKQSTRRKLDFKMNPDGDMDSLIENGIKTSFEQDSLETQQTTSDITATQTKEHKQSNSEPTKVHEDNSHSSKQKKRNKKNDATNNFINKSKDVSSEFAENKKQNLENKSEKLSNTQNLQSTRKGKTEHDNKILGNTRSQEYLTGDKTYCKTDNVLSIVSHDNSKPNNFSNRGQINCDNNNVGEIVQNCDNKTKNKQRKSKKKIKENFDFVINDAQKFFDCFSEYTSLTSNTSIKSQSITSQLNHNHTECNTSDPIDKIMYNYDNPKNSEVSCIPKENVTSKYNLFVNDEKNHKDELSEFCSQTDDETEKCITKSCDKVPDIVQRLNNEENEQLSNEFEENDVTFEMLCTVFGMKKIIGNLIKRRMKVAKPDAFVVEHIDFLVTMIKRDKNQIKPVYYYGHNYGFLNAELAFVTLNNKNGLYLVSK